MNLELECDCVVCRRGWAVVRGDQTPSLEAGTVAGCLHGLTERPCRPYLISTDSCTHCSRESVKANKQNQHQTRLVSRGRFCSGLICFEVLSFGVCLCERRDKERRQCAPYRNHHWPSLCILRVPLASAEEGRGEVTGLPYPCFYQGSR